MDSRTDQRRIWEFGSVDFVFSLSLCLHISRSPSLNLFLVLSQFSRCFISFFHTLSLHFSPLLFPCSFSLYLIKFLRIGRGGHQMLAIPDVKGIPFLWIFGGRGGDNTGLNRNITHYNDMWYILLGSVIYTTTNEVETLFINSRFLVLFFIANYLIRSAPLNDNNPMIWSLRSTGQAYLNASESNLMSMPWAPR